MTSSGTNKHDKPASNLQLLYESSWSTIHPAMLFLQSSPSNILSELRQFVLPEILCSSPAKFPLHCPLIHPCWQKKRVDQHQWLQNVALSVLFIYGQVCKILHPFPSITERTGVAQSKAKLLCCHGNSGFARLGACRLSIDVDWLRPRTLTGEDERSCRSSTKLISVWQSRTC